jgi:hypothetical protein
MTRFDAPRPARRFQSDQAAMGIAISKIAVRPLGAPHCLLADEGRRDRRKSVFLLRGHFTLRNATAGG